MNNGGGVGGGESNQIEGTENKSERCQPKLRELDR